MLDRQFFQSADLANKFQIGIGCRIGHRQLSNHDPAATEKILAHRSAKVYLRATLLYSQIDSISVRDIVTQMNAFYLDPGRPV